MKWYLPCRAHHQSLLVVPLPSTRWLEDVQTSLPQAAQAFAFGLPWLGLVAGCISNEGTRVEHFVGWVIFRSCRSRLRLKVM